MDQIPAASLADFPGAPFTQANVDAVTAKIERALGWHVSPSKTETVTAAHAGGGAPNQLLLPSRYVTAVTEVRSPSGAVVPTWVLTSATEAILEGCWHPGRYEVDLTHGYETVPADLLGAIAAACVEFRTDPSLQSWTSGPFSATVRPGGSPASAVLMAYSVNLGV